MPKTTFARKPSTLADVRNDMAAIHAMHRQKDQPEDQEEYYIAEEIELSPGEWEDLTSSLLADRDWIEAFSAKDYPNDGGGVPCLRVTSASSEIALLIDTQGYTYARYVAIEAAAPASSKIEQPRIKLNEATSMDSRLVTEIQEQLDMMTDPEYTWQGKRWLDGMTCALSALTGQIWEAKRIDSKRCHANLYYLENEDGTERIIPSFLDF